MFKMAARVDKQHPLPRHAQVQQILRDMVTSGRLKPGDKIPAEVEIAEALGVSKMTVNKALLALANEGVFIREVGRGTFVAPVSETHAGNEGRSAAAAVLASTGAPPAAAVAAAARPRIALTFVEGATNILESHYYGSLYRAIVETLNTADAEVNWSVASPVEGDYLVEERRLPADGRLIIAPRSESIPSIEALWDAGRAVVVVGASWPGMGVPSVDSDNVGGAIEAVQHLASLGHRRIGLLYAEEDTANTQDRIVGYRRALGQAGLPHNPAWEVRSDLVWRAGDGAKARLTALLRGTEPVTAIFAAGYYLALEAMNTARDAGFQVPENVSVVGFDDPLAAQLAYPPLTTVRQPLHEMGRRAAERLLRLVKGEESRDVVREVLPAQLAIRRSTVTAVPSSVPVLSRSE